MKTPSNTTNAAFRYLIGGALTTVLFWVFALLFTEVFRIQYMISTNLATFLVFFCSYMVNKYFVFGDTDRSHLMKGGKYLALQFCILLLMNLYIFAMVSLINAAYFFALVTASAIAAVINFNAMRLFIFRSEKSA
jgi:putative flippase GtrA